MSEVLRRDRAANAQESRRDKESFTEGPVPAPRNLQANGPDTLTVESFPIPDRLYYPTVQRQVPSNVSPATLPRLLSISSSIHSSPPSQNLTAPLPIPPKPEPRSVLSPLPQPQPGSASRDVAPLSREFVSPQYNIAPISVLPPVLPDPIVTPLQHADSAPSSAIHVKPEKPQIEPTVVIVQPEENFPPFGKFRANCSFFLLVSDVRIALSFLCKLCAHCSFFI